MPFLHHYPEPPAVLVARILGQARGLIAPTAQASRVLRSDDPWGDGGLASAWFAAGDRHHPTQGGSHA
jgi:hypothetical protein